MANERAINVSQATQIATSIKGQLTNINGRLAQLTNATGYTESSVAPNIKELLGTSAFPFGWRDGAYDKTTGEATAGTPRYIRTITGGANELVAPLNSQKARAKAPEGHYISIYEYDGSTYIKRYGVPNPSTGDGTNEITIDVTPGYTYKLCVGYAGDRESSTDWLTEEFLSQIEFEFIMNGRVPGYALNVDADGNLTLVRA